MTNYHAGRRAEYEVMLQLREQGFVVARTAGSHSPVDIIAFDAYSVLLLQVKSSQHGRSYSRELAALAALPVPEGVVKQLWFRNRQGWHKIDA